MARRTLLRKLIVKFRMWIADVRGHHGKVWDYGDEATTTWEVTKVTRNMKKDT